jgi:hypothetical protein
MKTIQITQECIDRGEQGYTEYCPIALALTNKGYKCVNVGQVTVKFADNKEFFTFNLPCDAREFIAKFDEGEEVAPFELVLTNRIK